MRLGAPLVRSLLHCLLYGADRGGGCRIVPCRGHRDGSCSSTPPARRFSHATRRPGLRFAPSGIQRGGDVEGCDCTRFHGGNHVPVANRVFLPYEQMEFEGGRRPGLGAKPFEESGGEPCAVYNMPDSKPAASSASTPAIPTEAVRTRTSTCCASGRVCCVDQPQDREGCTRIARSPS